MARDPSAPNYRPPEWDTLAQLWERSLDIYQGLHTVEMRLKYLNQKSGEDDDDLQARAKSSELDNRYRSSIQANAGMLSQFEMLPETPEAITDYEDDIDNRGNSLKVWGIWQDVKLLRDGGVLLGVDTMQAPTEDDQRQDRRPWLVSINIRDVFAPLVESINGKPTLTRVSIRRTSFEPSDDGEFDRKKIHTYWVYRLVDGVCTLRLWRSEDDKEPEPQDDEVTLTGANGEPLPMLPFVWYGVTDTLDFSEELPIPPFATLLDLCIKHFNKGSELDRAESICNIPTPKRGWPGTIPDNPPPFRLGVSRCAEYVVGGEIGFLEPTGGSLALSHQRQLAREARMEAEDRRFFGAAETEMTATQSLIEAGQAQMTLATVAERKESAIEELFRLWLMFADPTFVPGESEAGGIQINEKVLQPPPNPALITQYREDVALGLISTGTYRKTMLRLGVYVPDDFEGEDAVTPTNATGEGLGL